VKELIPPDLYDDVTCVPWARIQSAWAWITREHAVFHGIPPATFWPRVVNNNMVAKLTPQIQPAGNDLVLVPAALHVFAAMMLEGHDVTLVHTDDCLRAYRDSSRRPLARNFDVIWNCDPVAVIAARDPELRPAEVDAFTAWLQGMARTGVLVPSVEETRRLCAKTARQRLFEAAGVPTLPTLIIDSWPTTPREVRQWFQGVQMPAGFVATRNSFVAKRDFSYGGGHVHRLSSRGNTFSEFKGFGAIVQPHVAAVEQFEVKCVVVGGPRPTCFVTHPRNEVHMTRMLTSWMSKRGVKPAQARGYVDRVCAFSREVVARIRAALDRSFAFTDFIARVDVVCSAIDGDFRMVVNEVEWDAGFSTFAGTGVRVTDVEAAGGLVPARVVRRPEDRADIEANLALFGSMRGAVLACLHTYAGGAPCPPPGGIPTRCFRTRRGCTGVNPWIEFRVFNAGRGMRMAEASAQYRRAKDS